MRALGLGVVLFISTLALADDLNPLVTYRLAWTSDLNWMKQVSIADFPGESMDVRLEKAQESLGAGGGTIYFPGGVYQFKEDIRLRGNVILMGDPPKQGDARKDDFNPQTKFEFPKYVPNFEGDGTPNGTAFKGIRLADPATASNCGIVNIAIDRGQVWFAEGANHTVGRNRFVAGCLIRNAAVPDPAVPDKAMGQHGWQRFPSRTRAAIAVYSAENALVANNRIPRSGDENFLMKGYVIEGRRDKKPFAPEEGILFDYDNRPGIVVNHTSVGGGGGAPPRGTPEMFPYGFRKGIVIRDNYVYCSGRTAIGFTGDGGICANNVIRYTPNVVCWTVTGRHQAAGSSTNGNRAVEMRGWRWVVEGNDYEVYRNRVGGESRIYINDGEGLMHEGHANSIVKDSRLVGNKGNSYLSIFATGGIDGLLIEGNDIRPKGPGTDVKIESIYVVADQYSRGERHECRNVRIINNTTAGSGIRIAGEPAENNIVKGNRNVGARGRLYNQARAVVENNENYEVIDTPPVMRKPTVRK